VFVARCAFEEIDFSGGGNPRQPEGLNESHRREVSSVDFCRKVEVLLGLEEMGDDASGHLMSIPLPPKSWKHDERDRPLFTLGQRRLKCPHWSHRLMKKCHPVQPLLFTVGADALLPEIVSPLERFRARGIFR